MGPMGTEISGEDQQISAPTSSCPSSSAELMKHTPRKRGNVWTALAHIITAVIGSGVLSLAWSMSQLGWIAGPLTMLAFASVTLTSALLLRHCYKSPGLNCSLNRNGSYIKAVQNILGKQLLILVLLARILK